MEDPAAVVVQQHDRERAGEHAGHVDLRREPHGEQPGRRAVPLILGDGRDAVRLDRQIARLEVVVTAPGRQSLNANELHAALADTTAAPDSSGTTTSSANGDVQSTVYSLYPVRLLDRPVTLPRGAARLDFFGLASRQPQSPTAWTTILGGGVGVTNSVEMGGQIVPLAVAPGVATFTNPSVYATYTFNIKKVSLAPTAQVVFPLADDDPFFVDFGVPLYYNIGTLGYIEFAPTFSMDTRANGSGTSLSLPVTFMRQVTEQFNWQISSGVGLSRFDPRFGLARRGEEIEFDDVTIPLSAEAYYTLEHGTDHRPLVDVILQFQWPQLYTRMPGQRGTNTDDWAVQLTTSWYFFP